MATLDLSEVDNSTILDEDDLRDIMNEISGLHAQFQNLGRELGIKAGDLDGIHHDGSQNSQGKLNKVILLWLNQKYTVDRFGKPTWRRLVEAVNKINPAQAKKIVCNLKEGKIRSSQQNGGSSGDVSHGQPSTSASSVSEAASALLSFSEEMSDDEFLAFMKQEGLSDADCLKLNDNGIGVKVFIELTEEDIKGSELGFSFGMKKIIKKVLDKYKSGGYSSLSTKQKKEPPPPTKESTGKSERLTIDDLNKVKKALLSARVEWEKIGLELEISAADLESIKNANRGNPDDCFIEMLKKFLKKGKPKPTWELLATTLEAEGIEYGALAEEVREKYL